LDLDREHLTYRSKSLQHGDIFVALVILFLSKINNLKPANGPLMMMIACITFKSSLVPLIEGLCSSNPRKSKFIDQYSFYVSQCSWISGIYDICGYELFQVCTHEILTNDHNPGRPLISENGTSLVIVTLLCFSFTILAW